MSAPPTARGRVCFEVVGANADQLDAAAELVAKSYYGDVDHSVEFVWGELVAPLDLDAPVRHWRGHYEMWVPHRA